MSHSELAERWRNRCLVRPRARSDEVLEHDPEPDGAHKPDHDAEGGRQRNSLLLMAGEERSSKLALTGAHLARESEITPSSTKVRRELFEIALQEQILFAAK